MKFSRTVPTIFGRALSPTVTVEVAKPEESKVIAELKQAPITGRAVGKGIVTPPPAAQTLMAESIALARRLLAYEAAAGDSSGENMPAVLCVSEKLRRHLSTLAGSSGFGVLLARSLTLAKAQDSRLSAVQITPDGSLESLGDGDQDAESGVILIAQLLELLVTFIGEELVLSLVLGSWPNFTGINSSERKACSHKIK